MIMVPSIVPKGPSTNYVICSLGFYTWGIVYTAWGKHSLREVLDFLGVWSLSNDLGKSDKAYDLEILSRNT